MKYHIETALIWDFYKQECECSLCAIEKHIEAQYVESYLSYAVMEPDSRLEVNKYGFCASHLGLLYKGSNKLGLALQLHTYLAAHQKELHTQLDALDEAAKETGLLRGKSGFNNALNKFNEYISNEITSCVICRYMDAHMERYSQAIAQLWESDTEFMRLYNCSKGFCLPHFNLMIRNAKEALTGRKLQEFIKASCSLQKAAFTRLTQEIDWFTKKFDYRNTDAPWGNSRDAVPRVVNKLKGQIIDKS